ncbi:MAG TPA: tyrosine-type recombinase/integrase [Acidimicrobiales bacterium]|nr:tyrosine-type recombinase/integrase [Acidimicrobiales bacterium]
MMLLADVVDVYVADRYDRGEIGLRTATHLRSRLASLVRACPACWVGQVDRLVIRRWQASIGCYQAPTRRAYLSTVKTFCRWAVEWDYLSADPTAGVARVREPKREPRALSDDQVRQLWLVLPDLRAEVIVGLELGCGLRCIEVARLSVRDYDPTARTLLVVGKGSDERPLPVPAVTATVLNDWLTLQSLQWGGRVVGLSANRISRLVSQWMAEAGIKVGSYDGVSAHALRHTFASNMLDRCGNVRLVQEALGHQSLATTQRYLRHSKMDEMRAAMEWDYKLAG